MFICHVFFVRFLGFTSFCCSIWSENTSRSITNRKRQRKSCEGFFPKVCGLLVVLRCSTFVLWRSWLWIYHVCTHVFGSFHGSIRIAGCWAQHPTWVPKLGPNSMLIGRSLRQGFKQDKRWAERGSMMTINKMVVSFCQFYGGFFWPDKKSQYCRFSFKSSEVPSSFARKFRKTRPVAGVQRPTSLLMSVASGCWCVWHRKKWTCWVSPGFCFKWQEYR